MTTNYAAELTAAPNGGQFQAIERQIAREHSIALSQSEYDWTLAAPVQIFFVLVAVLAVTGQRPIAAGSARLVDTT